MGLGGRGPGCFGLLGRMWAEQFWYVVGRIWAEKLGLVGKDMGKVRYGGKVTRREGLGRLQVMKQGMDELCFRVGVRLESPAMPSAAPMQLS